MSGARMRRLVNLQQAGGVDAGVDLRGRQAGMAEHAQPEALPYESSSDDNDFSFEA